LIVLVSLVTAAHLVVFQQDASDRSIFRGRYTDLDRISQFL
jgi:hypothetical protein